LSAKAREFCAVWGRTAQSLAEQQNHNDNVEHEAEAAANIEATGKNRCE